MEVEAGDVGAEQGAGWGHVADLRGGVMLAERTP